MKLRPLLLLGLLAYFSNAQAQQRVMFEDGQNELLVYNYANVQGISQNTVRAMLRDISPAAYQNAGFDLRYYRYARFTERAQFQYEAKIEFTNLKAENAPRFKQFSMDAAMLPEQMNFKAQLLRNGTIIYEKEYNQVPIRAGRTDAVTFVHQDSTLGAGFSIVLSNIYFVYGNTSRNAITQRLDYVNLYERANMDIDAMGANLTAMNTTNPDPDLVAPMVQTISGMEQQFGMIMSAEFWTALELKQVNTPDPLGIRQRSNAFGNLLNARKMEVSNLMANIHVGYYEKARVLFDQQKKQQAFTELQKSLRAKPDYAPSNYLTAVIDFENGKVNEAAERVKLTVNQYNPATELAKNCYLLVDAINDVNASEADALFAQKKYDEAIAGYEAVMAYGKSVRAYNLNEAAYLADIAKVRSADLASRANAAKDDYNQKNYSQALLRIDDAIAYANRFKVNSEFDLPKFRRTILSDDFSARLSNTETSIATQKWNDAQSQLNDAQVFRNKHSADLPDEARLRQVKADLYSGWYAEHVSQARKALSMARLSYGSQQVEPALQTIEQANARVAEAYMILRDHPDFIRDKMEIATVETELDLERYKCLYNLAERDLQAKNLEQALVYAQQAEQLVAAKKLNVSFVGNPVELMKRVQSARYAKMIQDGDALSKAGKNNDALKLYEQAKGLQRNFNLTSTAGKDLDSKITGTAREEVVTRVNALLSSSNTNAVLRSGFAQIQAYANEYQVAGSPEVSAALQRIAQQVCTNASALYQAHMTQADSYIAGKKFIMARQQLQAAADTLRNYPTCGISTERYNAVVGMVQACAAYEEVMAEAQKAEQSRFWAKAIETYASAKKMYDNSDLLKANVPLSPTNDLAAYLKASNIGDFQLEGAHYYEALQQQAIALDLMHSALRKNVNVKATYLLQNKLAAFYAKQDYNKVIKWKVAVLKYMPADLTKSMASFKKAYKKAYR